MAKKCPTTLAEYIDAALIQGQAHLGPLYTILHRLAPNAQQTIK